MSSSNNKYIIYYIFDKTTEWAPPMGVKKTKLPSDDIEIKEELKFYDYNLNSTIRSLKDYFLYYYGKKYDCCKCMLSLYRKESFTFGSDLYELLTLPDNVKLSTLGEEQLYLIKSNSLCTCKYKNKKNFFYMEKSQIIDMLIKIVEKNKRLKGSKCGKIIDN